MTWNWFKSKPKEAPKPPTSPVVEGLLKVMFDDKSKEARAEARAKIVELKQPETLTTLLASYKTGYSFRQGDVLLLLGELGLPQAVPFLIMVLKDKGSHGLQSSAARALGNIKDASAVPALLTVLDLSFWKRSSNWEGGGFGISRAEALREAERLDDRVRDAVYEALKAIGTPEALRAIAPIQQKKDAEMKKYMDRLFGNQGQK